MVKSIVFFSSLLLLIFPEIRAQTYNFDVKVESKPYWEVYDFDEYEMKGIKQRLDLTTDYTNGSPKTDTSRLHVYNREGHQIKYISYRKNKKYFLTLTEWHNNLKTVQKNYNYPDESLTSILTYTHDNKGNMTELLETNLINGDTSYYKSKLFTYDERGNLTEKLLFVSHNRSTLYERFEQKAEFEYDNNDNLVKHIHHSGNDPINPVSDYYYTNNLLDSVIRTYHTDTSDAIYDYNYFKHNKMGLLTDKTEPLRHWIGNEPDGETYHHYDYDNDGKLKHAHAIRKKDTITTVDYTFKDSLIAEITATRHSVRHSSNLYFFYPRYVIEARDKFIRNEKGHLIRKEHYIDGKLSKVVNRVYTYYE